MTPEREATIREAWAACKDRAMRAIFIGGAPFYVLYRLTRTPVQVTSCPPSNETSVVERVVFEARGWRFGWTIVCEGLELARGSRPPHA